MSNKPKIRFKGFTDDWEQRKGEEFINSEASKEYIKLPSVFGRFPVVQQGDNPVEGYSEGSPYKRFKNVTLFGDHTLSLYKPSSSFFLASDGVKILSCKQNINAWLFYYCLLRYKPNSEGYKRHLNLLKDKDYSFPVNEEEQNLIANAFKELENLITLHQRKLDKLKNIKKSLLENMFPKDNEKAPKIRFKGFTDDWEQRKLTDRCYTYSGGTPLVSQSNYYGGNIPFIRSAEINKNITELTLTECGLNNSSAKMVNKGDVLYALYGATSGEVGISQLSGAINQAVLAIIPKDDIDNNYLSNYLRNIKENIVDTYLQGGQGNLSGAIIKNLDISLPSYDEQRQIGLFLARLNDLITLHQRKCEKLKKIKKSLLENMFV